MPDRCKTIIKALEDPEKQLNIFFAHDIIIKLILYLFVKYAMQ